MIVETLFWIALTVFFAWVGMRKERFFKDQTSHATIRMSETKGKKYKTVEEQMEYVRDRANFGQDYVNVALGIVAYILIFYLIIYPNITDLQSGLLIVPFFALAFAYVSSRYIHPKEYFQYQFTTSFLNYFQVSLFFVYVRFINTIHPLLLLLLSILIMYSLGLLEVRLGRNDKNR